MSFIQGIPKTKLIVQSKCIITYFIYNAIFEYLYYIQVYVWKEITYDGWLNEGYFFIKIRHKNANYPLCHKWNM